MNQFLSTNIGNIVEPSAVANKAMAGLCSLALFVGSGGCLNENVFKNMLSNTVTTTTIMIPETIGDIVEQSIYKRIDEKLIFVQFVFNLSVSDLSKIMKLKRPTIYKWLDVNNPPKKIREDNQKRLDVVFDIAQKANSLLEGIENIDFLSLYSLLPLLKSENLDEKEIMSFVENIVEESRKKMRVSYKPTEKDNLIMLADMIL